MSNVLNRVETAEIKKVDWKKDSPQTIADSLWARKQQGTYSTPMFQIDQKIEYKIITRQKAEQILKCLQKKGYKPRGTLTDRMDD